MASKINTKFVLVIVLALAFAGVILGGLWFLQYRGDATRNVRHYPEKGILFSLKHAEA